MLHGPGLGLFRHASDDGWSASAEPGLVSVIFAPGSTPSHRRRDIRIAAFIATEAIVTEAIYVDTPAKLTSLIDSCRESDFLALDTEFMRERTYFPQLCLIQMATSDVAALIDPLALRELRPLYEFLAEPTRVKVLHAARQDLEVLLLAGGRLPAPLFDTQVAAGLLGLPGQIGFGDAVSKRLGHTLAKGLARTDWARRPLSAEQLVYAADDVRFLVPLYLNLREALQREGRLGWLEEDMRLLGNESLYSTEPAAAWQRLRGLEQLAPAQRAAVKRLAAWREERAIRHDKPRSWILADDALRAVAERLPTTSDELQKIAVLPPATARRHGEELLELLTEARNRADQEPPATPFVRADPAQTQLAQQLMARVRKEAEKLRISPELLATRRDIEQLVFAGKLGLPAEGWRREVIGQTLLAMAGEG